MGDGWLGGRVKLTGTWSWPLTSFVVCTGQTSALSFLLMLRLPKQPNKIVFTKSFKQLQYVLDYTTINQIFCTNKQICHIFKHVIQINWYTVAHFEDSSVPVVTRPEAGWPENRIWFLAGTEIFVFAVASRKSLGPTWPHIQWALQSL